MLTNEKMKERQLQGAHTVRDKDNGRLHIQILWPPSSQEDINTVQIFLKVNEEGKGEECGKRTKQRNANLATRK
jgi:hypothetical protein